MKKIILLLVVALAVLPVACFAAEKPLTPEQRLELIPLPPGVSVERNVDFSKDPILEFSQQHNDFASIDPFMMERRAGAVPEHCAILFTAAQEPREVFLFFKRFFNTESEKTERERTLPFYGSRSYFSFDQKNEADVTRDKTIGSAVFYRIEAMDGRGHRLDITIFNDGKHDKTKAYVSALDEKK